MVCKAVRKLDLSNAFNVSDDMDISEDLKFEL